MINFLISFGLVIAFVGLVYLANKCEKSIEDLKDEIERFKNSVK